MTALLFDGAEAEFRLPKLAKRVQAMATGACSWAEVAAAAHDEFIAPLHILGFAALERADAAEPFRTVLSSRLPLLPVGKVGPRSTIACFVQASESPGQVFVTDEVAGCGPLACAALISDTGSQQLIVLAGHAPSVTNALLGQVAGHLLDLIRPAAGGAAARKPADAVSIAIRRAKREWESVADGLPAMVGLADDSGRVLRVNRSWTRVPGHGLGQSIHALLHENCSAPDCGFAKSMASALKLLPSQRKLVMRTRIKGRDSALTVYLRHVPARVGRGARVVFSISELSVAERELHKLQAEKSARDEGGGVPSRSHQELERLLEKHHLMIDDQRRQFAGDVCASLRQSLLAAKLGIDAAMDALRRDPNADVLSDLERSAGLIQSVMQDAEGSLNRQRQRHPEELGLAKALRAQCADWMAAAAGDAKVNCVVDDRNVPKSLWLTIHRIVHEALHSLPGASGSGALGITLVPGDRALLLAIEYAVEGRAPTRAAIGMSPGLLLMRELAEFSGGSFRCDTAADGSTTVEVLWSRPAAVSPMGAVPSPVH